MIQLHANASLPRSGSELLQCLLSQHPDIYGSSTSPLLDFWYGAMANRTTIEVRSQPKEMMDRAFTSFMREGAIGYYRELTDRPIVVDKSRGWMEFGELLFDAFPNAKVVSMVRPVEEILESFDRVYLKNPGHPETRNLPRVKEQRHKRWMESGSLPLGIQLDRMNMRKQKGIDKRFLYVPYKNLVENTQAVMDDVFKHLEVEPIVVDTQNVTKLAIEDTSFFGIFGDHNVRSTVGYAQ